LGETQAFNLLYKNLKWEVLEPMPHRQREGGWGEAWPPLNFPKMPLPLYC